MQIDTKQAEELKPIEPGTIAKVRVRDIYDQDLQSFRKMTDGDMRVSNKTGDPYLSVQVQVLEGDYQGRRAGTMLYVKADNRFFKIYEIVTGKSVSMGDVLETEPLYDAFHRYAFTVELSPGRPDKETGEPSKYTDVRRFIERNETLDEYFQSQGDQGDGGASPSESQAVTEPEEDEDPPF